MFHQSANRSQRAKSSKIRNILQVSVLLAVVVWLLYQTKHSYDRKTEYAETDDNRLSQGNSDINLGRKASAGSQNGIIVYPQPENSDEANETREISVDQESAEEKAQEVKGESEESQEESPSNDKEEAHQEQQGNVDNNVTGEVNNEGAQEDLRLPDEISRNEENEHPKEDPVDQNFTSTEENDRDMQMKTSDEATFSSSTSAEAGENGGQGSETDSNNVDKEAGVTEELSSSSGSDDQSNVDISNAEAHADSMSDDEITSNSIVEENSNISNAEIVQENLDQHNSTSENGAVMAVHDQAPKTEENEIQEESTSQAEITDTNSSEDAASGTKSDGDVTNSPNSAEENKAVMQDSNGVPGHEEGESQADTTSEGQATNEISSDSVNNDTSSEGEKASSTSSEENSTVMSDNSGVPKEELKLQVEELKSKTGSNDELPEKSPVGEQTEAAAANAAQEQKDMNSSDEIADSSLSNEETVEGVQPQGNDSIEEAKPENSDDVVADPSQNNMLSSSEITGNEELVTSHEESSLKVENTSTESPEDTMIEPVSNNTNNNDSDSKTELSSSNATTENEQEPTTDMEKSSEI